MELGITCVKASFSSQTACKSSVFSSFNCSDFCNSLLYNRISLQNLTSEQGSFLFFLRKGVLEMLCLFWCRSWVLIQVPITCQLPVDRNYQRQGGPRRKVAVRWGQGWGQRMEGRGQGVEGECRVRVSMLMWLQSHGLWPASSVSMGSSDWHSPLQFSNQITSALYDPGLLKSTLGPTQGAISVF